VEEVTYADGGRTVVTNLRLPGQYDERLLGALGLQGPYYNWNRWYLPSVGRFLELDPIAKAGGFNGFYGPNWYAYAEGNPVRYTDRRGLWSFTLSFYEGFGMALFFGQDPDSGKWFWGERLGIGLDWSIGWDPEGRRPGAGQVNECGPGTSFGTRLGAGVSWGPHAFNLLDAGGGVDLPSTGRLWPLYDWSGAQSYSEENWFTTSWTNDPNAKSNAELGIGWTIGFEITGHQ
jgi:RHS repeat-associated protein